MDNPNDQEGHEVVSNAMFTLNDKQYSSKKKGHRLRNPLPNGNSKHNSFFPAIKKPPNKRILSDLKDYWELISYLN